MLTPRDYQGGAVTSVVDYMKSNKGNPLVSACVASGKSLMIAELVKLCLGINQDTRVLMLTHVKELIDQNHQKLLSQFPDVDSGIVSASMNRREYGRQVTYAGIASIYKNIKKLGWIHLLIIDEVHLLSPDGNSMYRKTIAALKKINPKLRVIGFTGTPWRLKGGHLLDGEDPMFDDICYEVGLGDLVRRGFLAPLISPPEGSNLFKVDLNGLATSGGEFVSKDMQKAMDKEKLTKAAVDDMVRLCSDRKSWLIFCAGVEHADHVRDEIRSRGLKCESINGNTPKKEREKILDDLRHKRIDAVTNNLVLTTGTDIPNIDMVAFLRGTQSPGLWIQMCGRGARVDGINIKESIKKGKRDCMIMDFCGNIDRFGPIDKIQFERKKPKKKSKHDMLLIPSKTCPNKFCLAPNPVQARECSECGTEFDMEHTIVHDQKASTALAMDAKTGAIESDDIVEKKKFDEWEIADIHYNLHRRAGKRESLKVTYLIKGGVSLDEWVGFNHDNDFVRGQAQLWWSKRSPMPCPRTTKEVVKRFGELRVPRIAMVKLNKEDEYEMFNVKF